MNGLLSRQNDLMMDLETCHRSFSYHQWSGTTQLYFDFLKYFSIEPIKNYISLVEVALINCCFFSKFQSVEGNTWSCEFDSICSWIKILKYFGFGVILRNSFCLRKSDATFWPVMVFLWSCHVQVVLTRIKLDEGLCGYSKIAIQFQPFFRFCFLICGISAFIGFSYFD